MVKRGDKIGHIQYMYKWTNEYIFILFFCIVVWKINKRKIISLRFVTVAINTDFPFLLFSFLLNYFDVKKYKKKYKMKWNQIYLFVFIHFCCRKSDPHFPLTFYFIIICDLWRERFLINLTVSRFENVTSAELR